MKPILTLSLTFKVKPNTTLKNNSNRINLFALRFIQQRAYDLTLTTTLYGYNL